MGKEYGAGGFPGVIESHREAGKARMARLSMQEDTHVTEGIKSLLAINGGGAVAMLGFIQSLVLKIPSFTIFKPFGSVALLLFAIGFFVAAIIPALRVSHARKQMKPISKKSRWEFFSFVAWGLSLTLFLAGLIAAGIGISLL